MGRQIVIVNEARKNVKVGTSIEEIKQSYLSSIRARRWGSEVDCDDEPSSNDEEEYY